MINAATPAPDRQAASRFLYFWFTFATSGSAPLTPILYTTRVTALLAAMQSASTLFTIATKTKIQPRPRPSSPGRSTVRVDGEAVPVPDAPSSHDATWRDEEDADQEERSEDRPRQQFARFALLTGQGRDRFEPAQRQEAEHDPVKIP